MGSSLNDLFKSDATYPPPLPGEGLAQYATRTQAMTGLDLNKLAAMLANASAYGDPSDPASVVRGFQNQPPPSPEQLAAWEAAGYRQPEPGSVKPPPVGAPGGSGGIIGYDPSTIAKPPPGGKPPNTTPPVTVTPPTLVHNPSEDPGMGVPGSPGINSAPPGPAPGPQAPGTGPLPGTPQNPIPMPKVPIDPITGQPIRPPIYHPPSVPVLPGAPPPPLNPLAPGPGAAPMAPGIQASRAYQQPGVLYPGKTGGPLPTIDQAQPRVMPPPPAPPPPMGPLQGTPPARPGLAPIEQVGHQDSQNNGPMGLGHQQLQQLAALAQAIIGGGINPQ